MHHRACIIGSDGRFDRSVTLDCADDAEAMTRAEQLLDGHDIELWQRDRTHDLFGKPRPTFRIMRYCAVVRSFGFGLAGGAAGFGASAARTVPQGSAAVLASGIFFSESL